jgi:hypothetical protein
MAVTGSLVISGNLVANQYIVSSSTTYYTESYADGSHIFGDTALDYHRFTGSVSISGSLQVPVSTGTPALNATGALYYDTTDTNIYRYTGTAWVKAAGTSGTSGTSGSSGTSGTSGSSGSNGSSGTSGSSGSSGTSGSSGSNGSSGTSGSSGSNGSSGTSGSSGSSGTSGSSGSNGSSGTSGSSGSNGSSGTSGSSGSNGSSGTSGSSGSNGSSGTSGSSGSNGSSGTSGTSVSVSGTNNTMVKFTGASTVGNSNLVDTGTMMTASAQTLWVTGALVVGGSTTTTTVGTIRAAADVIAYAASDKRLKDNIFTISGSLDKLMQINGVEFDWVPMPGIHENEGHDIGVIAQEIQAVLPEVVTMRDNGYLAVKYEKLVALLIESNKELLRRVEALEAKVK